MLGGKGRPVIGRVEPPSGWTTAIDFSDRSEARIESNRPFTPIPFSLLRGKTSLASADLTAWHERWRDSPERFDYHDRRVSTGVALAPDGSFRIDDVPAGEYRLAVRVNGGSIHHVTVQNKRNSGPFAHVVRVFAVPPVPNGRSDEPIDVGVLRLTPRVTLKAGEPAPAFKLTTVDGRKLSVPEDFRGKFLLIDFGTLWDIAAPHQITLLNVVNQKFGKDTRFAILSLTMAADNSSTRKSIEDKGEPWPQAIVGTLSNAIASAYSVDDENASTATLIGPTEQSSPRSFGGTRSMRRSPSRSGRERDKEKHEQNRRRHDELDDAEPGNTNRPPAYPHATQAVADSFGRSSQRSNRVTTRHVKMAATTT